ncbi:uncharacterized protein TRUGW13939_04930 [Talaromyces rugulosus]|uniref:Uncharacterized protein n=1 Tax=Talaromyces rugulosus TaxID=121627 RepID=A0A7H8QUX5_TALRU|nr:uncharacterized protein TRUGW13939_04930 [Talaromyces rugulosus]QKX57810.1 hypothetical protein TRUGW13939_04930 [Talaromyces rugulosus]
MDKLLSTADIPSRFLKSAFLIGHVPLKALSTDPRVSFALYVPPNSYSSTPQKKLPLVVYVHGTRRNISPLFSQELTAFADSTPCAILAPVFPTGLDGPNDLLSYTTLRSQTLRSDLALLAILDEISVRWPGINAEKVFMMGFSAGGQFAHRFLYLYPERIVAASIGAPGQVTTLNDQKDWPIGVANIHDLFDRPINKELIGRVPIQLVVGDQDTGVHGGDEFRTWVRQFVKKREEKSETKTALPAMKQGRMESLKSLQETWREDKIDSQLDVVPGVVHSSAGVQADVLKFLGPQIQSWLESQSRSTE